MLKIFRNIFVVALSLFLLCSCFDDKGKKSNQRTTGSAPYEMLVLANKAWTSTSDGELFLQAINPYIPGLPRAENCFRLTIIDPVDFNNTFKVYANIVSVDIDKKYRKADMKMARDVYAHPQIILSVVAPDYVQLMQLMDSVKGTVNELFVKSELDREMEYLAKKNSGKVKVAVRKMFGADINVPRDIESMKLGDSFIWASAETRLNDLNFCMYSLPYTSTDNFTESHLLAQRDSIMEIYVRGDKDDQYMTTDTSTVSSRSITVNKHFVFEYRGLWAMKNDMMGGPFVAYAQVDTANNRILVCEGFVFAPDKNKRNLIREMEASLRTLKLPASKNTNK